MTDRALLLIEDKLDSIERLIEGAKGRGCVDCSRRITGAPTKRNCLEFHHLDPATKSFTIGNRYERNGRSLAEVRAELAKCVVLCKSCHTRRHVRERWAIARALGHRTYRPEWRQERERP